MAFTPIAERTVEEHPFDTDHTLVMELYIPDSIMYDSLYHFKINDVTASVVFYFDEGNNRDDVPENYQFSADTSPDDADRTTKYPCLICNSKQGSRFKCSVWFRSSKLQERKALCEDCLESFLGIRDEFLEEFSSQIAAESL